MAAHSEKKREIGIYHFISFFQQNLGGGGVREKMGIPLFSSVFLSSGPSGLRQMSHMCAITACTREAGRA